VANHPLVVMLGVRGKGEQEFRMKYTNMSAGFNSERTASSVQINTYTSLQNFGTWYSF